MCVYILNLVTWVVGGGVLKTRREGTLVLVHIIVMAVCLISKPF